MRAIATAALLLAAALPAARAAGDPVPIEEEPMHRLAFRNGHVRFFDVRLPAGYRSVVHLHHHDGVFVNIAPSETEAEDWGRAPVRRAGRAPGETYFIGYATQPKAHRVSNVGQTLYHVTDTEILQGCGGRALPDDARSGPVLVDNERVRVARIELEPGETTLLHGPCGLLVAVTPGLALLSTPGGAQELSLEAAGFAWRDGAAPVPLTNVGRTRLHFVDILVK